MLSQLGLQVGPTVPTREWRELYRALDCPVAAAIHPHYTAVTREFDIAGRKVVGSAPVGCDGTAAWLTSIANAFGIDDNVLENALQATIPAIRGALDANPISGRITVSGYEGSELLVARLLIESGAEVPYVGTACPKTAWSAPDLEWLSQRNVEVKFRASLEQDINAVRHYQPDLAIGTTPVVQYAKERKIPSLYFTNLISARPLMGVAGAGSLATVINAAMGNRARFNEMSELFDGVGSGYAGGIWSDLPTDDDAFRAKYQKSLERQVTLNPQEADSAGT
jgi:chlorophyllide a reductase subunit Y